MHYLETGSETGTPVIALHGWPETSHEYTLVAPLLGDNIRLIAPDTRGHGDTEAPESGYDRVTLAQDIVDFMDAHEIEKCPVIAHDWGGIIACKLALDHGDRVERLVMMDTICTGWPEFVQYYYWFMDGDRAERFFTERAQDFIRSIVGGHNTGLPAPPECPVEFQAHELVTPEPWATEEHLETYWQPYLSGEDARVSCEYYRNLEFHKVIEDPTADHAERYEHISHDEMGEKWREQSIEPGYLDYAPEDRHKQYTGETLWLYCEPVLQATGSTLNDKGIPVGDAAFNSFSRHFPNLTAHAMPGGHFFLESHPEEAARRLRDFLT